MDRTRLLLVFAGALTAVVSTALIAAACVPNKGGVKVENISAQDSANQGTATFTPGTSDGFIVGDGNPETEHVNSWCGEFGGHPTEAVYAQEGDTLEVSLREATQGEVDSSAPCPEVDNSLDDGTTHIWLENGQTTTTSEDVYTWDETDPVTYPNGFWNQGLGPGSGCYAPGTDPIEQDTFTYDGGTDSHQFTLTSGDQSQLNENTDLADDGPASNLPGDGASLLCVGDDTAASNPVAIFAPVVITEV